MAKHKTAIDTTAIRRIVEALESGAYLRSNKESRDLGQSWRDAPYLDSLRAMLPEEVTARTTDGVTGEYVSDDDTSS